jgi:class 3 adenylate cyclase
VTDMDDNPSVSMKRRLAAILAADIAGYSRLMGEDEAATVRDLKGHQAAVLPLVGRYGGRIIDTAGDGILAEFPSVINAKNPPSKRGVTAVAPRVSRVARACDVYCCGGGGGGGGDADGTQTHCHGWRTPSP